MKDVHLPFLLTQTTAYIGIVPTMAEQKINLNSTGDESCPMRLASQKRMHMANAEALL